MEVREGPITQVTAVCLMVATGHPFEDMTATYHQPSIAGDVAGRIRIVLVLEAHEGPNAQE